MTDKEAVKRLREKAEDTDELLDFQEATTELVIFLGKHLPKEKMEELKPLLNKHANTASLLGQKIMELSEEMADEE